MKSGAMGRGQNAVQSWERSTALGTWKLIEGYFTILDPTDSRYCLQLPGTFEIMQ